MTIVRLGGRRISAGYKEVLVSELHPDNPFEVVLDSTTETVFFKPFVREVCRR